MEHAFFSLKNFFLYFRERGRVGERKRNLNRLPLSCAPTRDWTCNPGRCPDQESCRWPFRLRDDAQPTEHLARALQGFDSLLTLCLQLGFRWTDSPVQQLCGVFWVAPLVATLCLVLKWEEGARPRAVGKKWAPLGEGWLVTQGALILCFSERPQAADFTWVPGVGGGTCARGEED